MGLGDEGVMGEWPSAATEAAVSEAAVLVVRVCGNNDCMTRRIAHVSCMLFALLGRPLFGRRRGKQ